MQTSIVFITLVSFCAAAGIYDCISYESKACEQLSVPPCNISSKTCYAHPNVCGSLRRYITSGYIGAGWTVVMSSYSFNCTQANIANCISESVITGTQPLAYSPKFCIPINMELYKNNIAFKTLGNHPATIFTPTPSPATTTCSILKFSGQNISLHSLIINGTNCNSIADVQTTGLMLGNSGAVIDSVEFIDTPVMISLFGSSCSNITIIDTDTASTGSLVDPVVYPIMIAATACDTAIPITYNSTSGNLYAAILTGPPTLVRSQHLVVFNFNTFQTNYVYQQPACIVSNTTTCPECTSDSNFIYIVIPVMIIVAILVIYGLSKALKKTRAKISHTQ